MSNSHHFSLIISHLNAASCTQTVTCIIHYPTDKEETLSLIIELKSSNTPSMVPIWSGLVSSIIQFHKDNTGRMKMDRTPFLYSIRMKRKKTSHPSVNILQGFLQILSEPSGKGVLQLNITLLCLL